MGKSLYDQKAYPMALSALEEAVRLDPKKGLAKMAPVDKPSISKTIGNFLKKAMPSFFDR